MIVLRYIGIGFLAAAFGAAAAEVLVPPRAGGSGWFVSAYDLWYTAWPGSLVFTQIRVERVAPFIWDPIFVSLLSVPGWLLFGLPGALMIWAARPKGFASLRERAEVRKYEETMMFYDDLIKDARDQGMDRDGDDMSPDHSGHDALDEIERQSIAEDEDLYSMQRAEAMRAEIARRRMMDPGDEPVPPPDEPPERLN